MRVLFIATMLALISLSRVSATDYVSEDGTWWQSLSDSNKITAIEGMLTGYDAGTAAGASTLFNAIADKEALNGRVSAKEFERIHDLALHVQSQRFSKLFSTYSDEITDFYREHPGASGTPAGDVLDCLGDAPLESCNTVAQIYSKGD